MVTEKFDYRKIFEEIYDELRNIRDEGEVASYIPELGSVAPDKFGIHLSTVDRVNYSFGNFDEKFSIQSIAKVLSLSLALNIKGDKLWERVGVEPSGTSFNSLVQLEYEKGIPRNPLINAGAIVVCDILVESLDNPVDELIGFIRGITGSEEISCNEKTAESERVTGFRNLSLASLMKAFGNIHNDLDTVLNLYFHMCSIEMTCEELAGTFLYLASEGVSPFTKKSIVSSRKAKRINSIMQMCGFYDEAGEFAYRTGLPGKSGVGGGIAAVLPGKYSIAVWSPKLNKKGNSFKGMKVLELLTTKTRSSIF